MRSFKAPLMTVAVTLFVCQAAFADSKDYGTTAFSMVTEPMREAIVNGDVQKYKAHHWIESGYIGGIEDATWDYTMKDGLQIHMNGHALIDENDYKGEVLATKKNLGYFLFEYDEFRKFYNNTGGTYHPYTSFEHIETDKDLHMDMGKMRLELGLDKENWPKVSLAYEHETKHGAKSRLTWFDTYEGTVDKKMSPSWAEVNETVDTFEIKESHHMLGFDVEGEQVFEFMKSNVNRHEQAYSTNVTASEHKRREQIQAPKSDLFSTHFGVERWFKDDKFFFSSGYRFYHLSNKEIEDIFEYNGSGVLTNFSNAEQVRNAVAHNQYDSHTWTGNLMWMPKPWFSIIPKLKMELMKRKGDSSYPKDVDTAAAGGGVVDGIIDQTALSNTDNKVGRIGESVSIRFTKIPRTSLYAETELEQVRNWISEDRQSLDGPDAQGGPSASDTFNRETITRSYRGSWTIGAHTSPVDKVYVTGHLRRRINSNDYDDIHESTPTSTAKSAFFDYYKSRTTEFMSRISWKPKKWIQPSFRYQFRRDDYTIRIDEQDSDEQSYTLSNIYTFDITSQLKENLFATFSATRQYVYTWTHAADMTYGTDAPQDSNFPAFKGDVDTFMVNLDYLLNDKMTLNTAIAYSRADNFDDYAARGLPLGVDNTRVDLMAGLEWLINKHVSVGPKYVFYHYGANPNAEYGEYNAHILWFDVTVH